MKIRPLLRSANIQIKAELRHNLTGTGTLNVLFNPLLMLAGIWFFVPSDSTTLGYSMRTFVLAGTVGACSLLVIYSLVSETYQDRINGTLLRVRTLPHGSLSWIAAKTASAVIVAWLIALIFLIVAVTFMDGVQISAGKIVVALLISLLSVSASTPLGFIAGALAKDVFTQLFAFVVLVAVFLTSGAFIPLTSLPTWLQATQQALPFYWAGHLTRWALLGENAAGLELSGSYHPALAVAILAAWAVIGSLIAVAVIRRSFLQQTLSALENARSKLMNQVGI